MKLETINNVLGKVGLVLVIGVDDGKGDDSSTVLWIERKKTYQARISALHAQVKLGERAQ